MNTTSIEILALLFLSVIADATNVDLANNTNFLLLLLLALNGQGSSCGCQNNCGTSTCPRLFV